MAKEFFPAAKAGLRTYFDNPRKGCYHGDRQKKGGSCMNEYLQTVNSPQLYAIVAMFWSP